MYKSIYFTQQILILPNVLLANALNSKLLHYLRRSKAIVKNIYNFFNYGLIYRTPLFNQQLDSITFLRIFLRIGRSNEFVQNSNSTCWLSLTKLLTIVHNLDIKTIAKNLGIAVVISSKIMERQSLKQYNIGIFFLISYFCVFVLFINFFDFHFFIFLVILFFFFSSFILFLLLFFFFVYFFFISSQFVRYL